MDQQTGLTNTSPKAQPADPKRQAQFDLILGRCRQIMGQAAQEWLATLEKAPVDGAVTLGTSTLRQVAMMSQKAGQPVDPVVLIHVGIQLVKDVAAVANAAGLVSDQDLPGYLKDVMSQSMMEYLKADAEDGLLTAQDKQRAAGVLQEAGMGPGMRQATGDEPGDGPGPDNAPMHENAEAPMMEQSEGSEEDGMLARMQKKGARR